MAAVAQGQGEAASGSVVVSKLRRAWRKERRFHHSRGLCFFLLWALALILLDFVVDWLFLIPGYGRVILLGINVVALASVAYREWWRYLRRYDPVRTALQVERRHPELSSLLVSYVQLSGDAAAESIASPTLIRALQRETIEVTRPLDFREIVSFRELKRIFLLSAAVVLFFGIISVNWSEYLKVLALRMINPSDRRHYPTQTQIEYITRDLTAQQGDAVTLTARAGGVVPKYGTLYVKPQDGPWETVILTASESAAFTYRFAEVYQTFTYRMRLGDVSSEVYTVRVIPPPRIVETKVHLAYPPYTGRRGETVDILNLELPEGTAIGWELHCDQALSAAKMVLEQGEKKAEAELTLGAEGGVVRLAMTPSDSFSYRYEWTEREHGYIYKEDVQYFVQLIPDTPPQVEIVTPTEDEKATVRKKLAVTWQGRDDYGIAKAWIVYKLNEDPEKRYALGDFRDRLVDQVSAWTLRESIPAIKDTDTITYCIEVADNHSGEGGPFLSRSQSRRLYIVRDAEYLQYIDEKRKKLLAEIKALHQQEEDADVQVETLKEVGPDQAPETKKPPEAK